ncbi:hypothetical protein BS639_17105 [Rouxiella silvae]|uniref:DUF4145 domain-containing protein n=1 Tax=Rouxiella silvae TaxID=1646373 RepID=A0ABX3TXS7_9GAMM|nr:DUF4145 domain-containing protein [Rouxiella silvae]ORJ20013.1 hypothetical protein BS639_17105 [Rouxiella silvae]
MSSWECPYCSRLATVTAVTGKKNGFGFSADTKYGPLYFSSHVHLCPNPECQEYTFKTVVHEGEVHNGLVYQGEKVLHTWVNKPQGIVKNFPEYIPKVILDDYEEAALIKDLSPKASATLARRCLQGMLRDFWKVKPARLVDEVLEVKEKISPDTWQAIDAVRNIGNIGAHMENDINKIIDVDPEEAELLIQLIETLIKDWYIDRHERQKRNQSIIDSAAKKKAEKKAS